MRARSALRRCRCEPPSCSQRTRVAVGYRTEVSREAPSSPPDVVVNLPPTRKPVPAPPPVPVIHSRAFILHNNKLPPVATAEDGTLATRQRAAEPKDINSIQDIIQRMDEQLNEIEANPPVLQKALYDVSRGPVGEATARGVSAAARLTVAATKEAARVAAPVGKWMLQEGMKAAMKLAAQAMEAPPSTGTLKVKKKGARK